MFESTCVASHLGAWACEPGYFRRAVAMVLKGTWPARAAAPGVGGGAPFQVTAEGVAVIAIEGMMTKGTSKFEGTTSTAVTRRTLRAAAEREDVRAILLKISSPGGYVDGTADLAADVARVAKDVPVEAYIEDIGASAAYWVASQAAKIWANPTALVGSLGTFQVLWDESKAYDAAGIKVHVLSTGPLKGAGQSGTEITPEILKAEQVLVDDLNAHFMRGVRTGRGMTPKQVDSVATGEVWIASKAKELGLIDGIRTIDEVVAALAARGSKASGARPRRAAADFRIEDAE